MAQQGQDPEILKQVHGILLTIAWFLLQNLGIWSLYFKNTPYGLYLHAFFMAMVGFINAVAPILMIARFGPQIILEYYFHHTWGFILYIIFPFLLISGSICLISKLRPSILPQVVRFRTIGHSIFGWVFILLVKVPLLIGWRLTDKESSGNILFGVIIGVEVCSYSLYLYLKFKREKIEQSPQQKSIQSLGLRSIKSLRDLRIYSNNFFIFENRVFNISQILATHPGGWEIIQAIKGREVDRFLYGVDPIQFYDVPKVSHSFDSINLAGPPIAILQIPRIFSIRQFNKGQVSLITCHDKDLKIHSIYLQLNHEKCKFSGYSDVLQLGQYYSLTLDRKKTRLYTIVNFLQPENVKLIMNISKGQIQFKRKVMFSINKLDNDLDNEDKFLDIQLIKNQKDLNNTTFVTLLMKKYNDGQFTSQFLNPNHQFIEVIISQPRGLGLSLDCISSNNIVIFAGGTGLYPFSDFIDLFFKAKLVEDQHPMSNIILDSDPVLKKRPFTNLIINLYIAVNQLDELHPITLYQCNQLSKGGHFKCHAKVKGVNLTKLKEKYPNITLQASRFEAIVDKHCNEDRETMFYMCGPVRFTKSIVNQLKKNNMPESYYLIV